MVDTATLDKRVRGGILDESGHSIRVEAFYASDTLKVLVATVRGETGYSTTAYYFLSPQDYVLDFTEWHYAQPHSVDVVSRSRQYFYFCDGEFVDTDYSRRARLLKQFLEEDALPLLDGW
jgi:hypothetical protein